MKMLLFLVVLLLGCGLAAAAPDGWRLALAGIAAAGWVAHRRLTGSF
jgi:hypothetical protein